MNAPFANSVLARALAAGVATAALLSAQSPAIAKVGVAAAVNTDAKGRPPGAAPRVISLGQTVIFNEEITTDGRGLVQILLLDGTTFTVGPNSQLTIDEFVYNPATGDAKVVASVAKGAFRFIGGQTSRKEGGATINTPVGTIGIRGAMVEGRVESSDRALFSMIFGDEVQFQGRDGRRSRIYEPGYTMVVQGGGGGGLDTNVRRRTEGDASTFQTALAGGDGQTGGAEEQPDDGTVENSPVTQSNSNLPNNAPIPTSRSIAVKSSDVEEVETAVGDADTRGNTPPLPQTSQGLVLYAPDPNAMSGFSIMSFSAPQTFTEEVVTFEHTGGRLVSDESAIDLPDHTGTQGDAGLETFTVDDGVFDGNILSGYAYAGRGDFAAYLLEYGTETTFPFYMIHGTGTDLVAAAENQSLADIRQYTLTSDPSTGGVPFFAPTEYGAVTNASATNFYVVEPGDSTTGEFETFMSWISIEGDGLEQKSAAFVTASANSTETQIDENEEEFEVDILSGSRRGSYRSSSDSGAVNMRGYMTTLPGPDGSHFFGDNADHFVIGSSLDPNDPFFDSSVDGFEGDEAFGSHHVASLVEETPQEDVARTTRTVAGFMAGAVESDMDPNYPSAVASDAGPNFFMQLNAENHSVAAVGVVGDVTDNDYQVDKYLLTFGAAPTGVDGLPIEEFSPLLTTGEGATGGNTFVNDDVYGAVQNNAPENTRILTDGYLGEGENWVPGEEVAHTDTTNAGSYLVSGRAVPIEGYSHCADCDFVDWGWWGTRVVVLPEESEALPDGRRDYVHMGTWVAGDITAAADMPTNISASYEGTMLGTVAQYEGEGGASQYIARGTFGMTYNFDEREGAFWITDFAGISLDGRAYGVEEAEQGLFYAYNSNENSDYDFYVSGAFVDNGEEIAAGVIGDFTITDYYYNLTAVGTIAGSRKDLIARVLTAPDIYEPIGSETAYEDAGARGLVGSTPESDRRISFSKAGGLLHSADLQTILPDITGAQGDSGLEAVVIEEAEQAIADGEAVWGVGYAGRGDFAAYMLGFEGDSTQPYHLIAGTPTPKEVIQSFNTGTNVREYTLTQDPLQGIAAPFFFDDAFGPMNNDYLSSTNLFIVESDTFSEGTNWDAAVFQSWVYIEGSGEEQKSAVNFYATSIAIDPDGDAELGGARRGSFRHDAFAGATNLRGGLVATKGVSGNTFFGDNAEHFVLGSEIDSPDGYADISVDNAGYTGNSEDGYLEFGYPFATHHVANLVDTTPQADLGRTSRTVNGFMAGMVESSYDGADQPYIVFSGIQPTFTLTLDAQTNQVSASAELADTVQVPYDIEGEIIVDEAFDSNEIVDRYQLAFGPGQGSGGGSAFVDDDRFAARQNGDNENTRLLTEEGEVIEAQDLPNKVGDSPGSYILSGRANPIQGYEHCTECSFLDWGWWGTRVRTDFDDGETTTTRSDYVHMGTWVAGDITNPDDLPTNVVGFYEGTAIGNVSRETEGGTAKYIASGSMSMDFDFGSRTGNMNINNFDGMNLISELSETSMNDQALFAGQLVGNGVTGGVSGAFVNDGEDIAAGVIGNFGLQGNGVLATGTIAGARQIAQ